jgi:hypothetical protein
MTGKIIKGKNFYSYLILNFILLICILAFYLSCESKSPTDAAAPSTETLAARGTKGTTQTTTSSSTTTTIKPLNPAVSSSTIVTSRNLTTTTIGAVQTTTTTISQLPDVQFCDIMVLYEKWDIKRLNAKGALPQEDLPHKIFVKNGGTIMIPSWGYCVKIYIRVKNVGGAPANNVKIIFDDMLLRKSFDRKATNFFELPVIHTLPNDSYCRNHPVSNIFWYGCWDWNHVSVTESTYILPECFVSYLKLQWQGATHEPKFQFKVCFYWPQDD